MSNHKGPSKVGIFLAGMGIGAIVALLFAPRTGEETRDLIGKKAGEGRDYIQNKSKEFRKQAQEAVERGVRNAEDLVDKGKSFVAKATS